MEQRLWTGRQTDYPIAAGHETAGVVAAVHDEGVIGVSVGDCVAIAFLDRCLQCDACRRGDTHLCVGKLQGRGPNRFRRIGGLADYAVVPAWKLFRMPAERSLDEIALCEPLACVVHSVGKGEVRFGDDVLVIGCGTMGYLHTQLARLRGRACLQAMSIPNDGGWRSRRGLARRSSRAKLWTVCGKMAPAGADVVFVTFGSQEAAAQASAAVRPGGRIVYYAGFPANVDPRVDASRLHRDETILTGARGQTLDDWQQATRLVAAELVDVRPLISARYPLERLSEALERATQAPALRVIVNP